MNFGKYTILDPVTHVFELEPEWTWTINPPTSGDELELEKFLIQKRVVVDASGMRSDMPPTNLEVAYREIALTFGGTTIPCGLQPGSSVKEIEDVLRQMPQPMVMELWDAVGEATIEWGPRKSEKN